ncbi:MAG: Tellurite resistance protein TerB [Anaerolineaceae bacterium 4572_78]|nr:MAG: Tellurite resistance protein TerB [Anaerolineaceae bacterium 4572_78]
MGLFDMFKGDTGEQMTPHLAFASSIVYMMGADGEIDNEEVGHLLSVLGGSKDSSGAIGVGAQNRELLRKAQQIVRTKSIDQFLAEISPILTDAQKICVLTNLIDSSLADGVPEPEEQQLFGKFMQAFGISESQFQPYFQVLSIKNDRNVFTDKNHPNNQAGFSVNLS